MSAPEIHIREDRGMVRGPGQLAEAYEVAKDHGLDMPISVPEIARLLEHVYRLEHPATRRT